MKKSLKKLALNKKAVSNLSEKINGGLKEKPTTTTDPTANTWCYVCPPYDHDHPIDTF